MSHDLKDVLDRTAVPPRRTLDVEDVRARGRQIRTRRRAAQVAVGVGAAAAVVLALAQLPSAITPQIDDGPGFAGDGTPTPTSTPSATVEPTSPPPPPTGTVLDEPTAGEQAAADAAAPTSSCGRSPEPVTDITLDIVESAGCVAVVGGQRLRLHNGPTDQVATLGDYRVELGPGAQVELPLPVSSWLAAGLHTIRAPGGSELGHVWVLDAPAQSAGEQAVLDALVAFAQNPSDATFADLPLANAVRLGLGQTLHAEVDAADLRDPQAWVIDEESYAAFSGPFSVLDRLRAVDPGDLTATAGPHPHCAGPPRPAPDGLDGLRRLSLQGDDDGDPSCIGWFTVDVFVDDDLQIRAVTLDLWEP